MGSLVQLDLFPDNEQLSFNFEPTMQKLGPSFTISENNRTADVYNRGTHFTIELYHNRVWQTVQTTDTEEEARKLSNEYVKAKSTI